ncbi:MAG TPA: CPBP family intramembrane glutamic endopeptidase [candidate division Zixibacteria bacterium]|nr:CPBP family intramembrane glutamic endopeptidase [candidate division Zixibacteria bacterium]
MDDLPGSGADRAEPTGAAPPSPIPPGTPQPAETPPAPTYRWLWLLSILLIVGGLLTVGGVLGTGATLVPGGPSEPEIDRLRGLLLLSGAVALIGGLLVNAVRSIVVRRRLPERRYRGPSIVVMSLLAAILATGLSLLAGDDLLALAGGDSPSVAGSLLLLTVTQVVLLVISGVFVFLPRALAGARFLPERGALRGVVVALVLAAPAWLAAELVGVLVNLLLYALGMEFEPGVVEAAIDNVHPLVLAVALVVVAPVAEEVFFRGVVYNAWEREYGSRRALAGSALLFALIHGSIFVFVPIALLGLLLARLYQQTRSLPAVIALHAGFNAISLGLGLLVRYDIIQVPVPT